MNIEDIATTTPELSNEEIEEIKLARQNGKSYVPPKGISREEMWNFIHNTLTHNGLHEFQDIMSYNEIYKMYEAIRIVDEKFRTLKQVMGLRKEILGDTLDPNS